MISLDNYCKNKILEQYKLPIDIFKTFDEFLDINNIDNITEESVDFYYNYNINEKFSRYIDKYNLDIFEMLCTQNNDKIRTKLLEYSDKFKISSIDYASENKSNKKPLLIILYPEQQICNKNSIKSNELLNNDIAKEFKHIIDFYGYYITLIHFQNNYFIIYIEGKYTDDIFKEIRNNGGYIYHITHKNLKETIKQTGLRPKVGKTPKEGGYRYFPERLYFIKHNKDKNKLKQSIKNIINDKDLLTNYIIVKVKLTNHNISLYKDTAYDTDDNIYTYCAISPKIIDIYDDINNI